MHLHTHDHSSKNEMGLKAIIVTLKNYASTKTVISFFLLAYKIWPFTFQNQGLKDDVRYAGDLLMSSFFHSSLFHNLFPSMYNIQILKL